MRSFVTLGESRGGQCTPVFETRIGRRLAERRSKRGLHLRLKLFTESAELRGTHPSFRGHLRALSARDPSLLGDDETIEVQCDFCGAEYTYSTEELLTLH